MSTLVLGALAAVLFVLYVLRRNARLRAEEDRS
jgi:hypothetical protein